MNNAVPPGAAVPLEITPASVAPRSHPGAARGIRIGRGPRRERPAEAQRRRTDLELRLADPRQLFAADPDFFFEAATIAPGVERLHEELRWRELDKPVRLTLHLPRSVIEPGLDRRCADAIRRYSTACRNRVDDELRGMLRDGLRALALGLVLLAVALAMSVSISRSALPESVRIFFGDGVFLVAAWVGMWYPLDTLVYSPRPLRRDRAVLDAMSRMELVIEPSD